MKYNIRAFSIMQVNQTEDILVWFKGPLLYKVSNGKMKFVFPWNVNQITVKLINSFPIYFWGFKGKREITILWPLIRLINSPTPKAENKIGSELANVWDFNCKTELSPSAKENLKDASSANWLRY